MRATLFAGCGPEVAAGGDGRVIAAGEAARAAAGPGASVHTLRGRAHAGFGDSHLHLQELTHAARGLDLAGAATRGEALTRVAAFAAQTPAAAWITGRGWNNDEWSDDARMLGREELDRAAGGRPVMLLRKDGHSLVLSSAALRAANITRDTRDPSGGVIERDGGGEPSGLLRESACDLPRRVVPALGDDEFDATLTSVLRGLAATGLTSVHTMDGPNLFRSLQRLHARRTLPIRVVWNLPAAQLDAAEGLGLESGIGDAWLRVWGVKVFLDGALGSRTAEMLDGSGVIVTPQPRLLDIVHRCVAAHLNVCLHAIGDAAVRRALDALETVRDAWPLWRPRIEHAQCVAADDLPRVANIGVIASMQPSHAVSDRAVADAVWGDRTAFAYAWGALHRSGAVLAFGSDAPVEQPDPLLGLHAATTWRGESGWHPELAMTREAAIHAYSFGPAYAAGMEQETGTLAPGKRCDLTVIDGGEVTATIVDGRVAWQRAS